MTVSKPHSPFEIIKWNFPIIFSSMSQSNWKLHAGYMNSPRRYEIWQKGIETERPWEMGLKRRLSLGMQDTSCLSFFSLWWWWWKVKSQQANKHFLTNWDLPFLQFKRADKEHYGWKFSLHLVSFSPFIVRFKLWIESYYTQSLIFQTGFAYFKSFESVLLSF